jgi:hypothetical protein
MLQKRTMKTICQLPVSDTRQYVISHLGKIKTGNKHTTPLASFLFITYLFLSI